MSKKRKRNGGALTSKIKQIPKFDKTCEGCLDDISHFLNLIKDLRNDQSN